MSYNPTLSVFFDAYSRMKAARKGRSISILFTATRHFVFVVRVIVVAVLSIASFGFFINWVYESGYYLPEFGVGVLYFLYLLPPGFLFWIISKPFSYLYFSHLLRKGIQGMPEVASN
jgi:hypothetical protein